MEIEITSAKYFADDTGNVSIIATIDGIEWGVPLSSGNRHYDEIMRQVNAGTLTIQEAE
jgi:uncharacterized GH25 family protein